MTFNSISIVIPVKDEQDTLGQLFEECRGAAEELGIEYEVIFVDDGSADESWQRICEIQAAHEHLVKGIRMRRNFGKSMALSAGFRSALGDVVFTLDADLQDDPKEIGKFLKKIESGYDCVSGWKVDRQDPKSKLIASWIFNKITSFITGIELHDFNCGFKAYRAEVVQTVEVYGELHRYIPVLARDYGYRIGEVAVEHHPRRYGQSKYGWERYARGLLDLITVMATTRYLKKPGHLYGGLGIVLGAVGSLILFYLAGVWFSGQGPIGNRPLFFMGILLIITSIQLISLGVLAEIMIKTSARTYDVERLVSEQLPPSKPGG